MLKDCKFNIATCFAVLLFGLIAILAFMMLMAFRMTWSGVNIQFFHTTLYIFFALLIIGSIMFSIEKK